MISLVAAVVHLFIYHMHVSQADYKGFPEFCFHSQVARVFHQVH